MASDIVEEAVSNGPGAAAPSPVTARRWPLLGILTAAQRLVPLYADVVCVIREREREESELPRVFLGCKMAHGASKSASAETRRCGGAWALKGTKLEGRKGRGHGEPGRAINFAASSHESRLCWCHSHSSALQPS